MGANGEHSVLAIKANPDKSIDQDGINTLSNLLSTSQQLDQAQPVANTFALLTGQQEPEQGQEEAQPLANRVNGLDVSFYDRHPMEMSF